MGCPALGVWVPPGNVLCLQEHVQREQENLGYMSWQLFFCVNAIKDNKGNAWREYPSESPNSGPFMAALVILSSGIPM
jgi:hypothetical protein